MSYSLIWSSFFMIQSNFFRASFPQATAEANCSGLILQSLNPQQDRLRKVREKERHMKQKYLLVKKPVQGWGQSYFLCNLTVTGRCFSGQLVHLTQPPVLLKVPEQFLYSPNKCFTRVNLLNKGWIKLWFFLIKFFCECICLFKLLGLKSAILKFILIWLLYLKKWCLHNY